MNKNKMSYSLTNKDIEKFLGPNHIIKYSELSKYDDIDDVFGDNNFVVVLIESKRNMGHWTNLLRYDDGTIEQFDSYEGTIDGELKYVSNTMKHNLHEINFALTELLHKRKTVWSTYRYQRLEDGIDTCGRWVILRIIMFVNGGMKLDAFENWFKMMKKQFSKASNDELVCDLIRL